MTTRLSSAASAVLILAAMLAPLACQQPSPRTKFLGTAGPDALAPLGQHQIVGSSVRGRPIMTHRFGTGPDVIFILATIHGDEPAGTPLLRELAQYLKDHPELLIGRTVLLLPVANPDGMARKTRHNANGVDLNRNFATANRLNSPRTGRSPLSEPEARAIARLIRRYAPDRIVSIHQRSHNQPPCIDYDGPARLLADHLARYCSLPVKKLGARPGSLGSYTGLDLAIPTITLELETADSHLPAQALWQKYGNALLAAITYPGSPP